MSKVYPRHGTKGGGERIRQTYQSGRHQQHQQQQQEQPRYSQRSSSSNQENDFDYWPSTFTILCSIPVLFILYHYFCKLLSKILWGSLPISVEISGPRLDHPDRAKADDGLYQWLLDWLAKNLSNLQNATVQLNKKTGRLVRYPGFGVSHFKYHGAWIKLERLHTPEIKCNEIPYEKMILSFVSSRRTRTLLYELLEECRPTSKKGEEKKDKIMVYGVDHSWPNCWKPLGSKGKRKRALKTVITADDTKDKVLKDVNEFLDSHEWYTEKGVPYRRGYLLYGPPGCGKTSLVRGIAGELGFDICILPLSSTKVNDDTLAKLMNSTPDNCVILLEDVDAVMKRQPKPGSASCPSLVSLEGLLSALDGIYSSDDGRIVFMTTNQVEILDPALTRPGRVDMKQFIGFPNDDQLKALFARFYPDAGIKMKSEFVKRVRELAINVTMAQIQGLFMFCKKDGVEAVNFIQEYFQDQFLISELEPK